MGFLTGKTAIITGAGRAVLKDGSCGSIGYGIASTKEVSGNTIRGRIRHKVFQDCSGVENNNVEVRRFSILG